MSSVTVDAKGKKKKSTAIKRSTGDVIFDVVNIALIVLISLIFIFRMSPFV